MRLPETREWSISAARRPPKLGSTNFPLLLPVSAVEESLLIVPRWMLVVSTTEEESCAAQPSEFLRPSSHCFRYINVPTGSVGGGLTTAVAAADAVAEPTELLAVTDARMVDPTSADARR